MHQVVLKATVLECVPVYPNPEVPENPSHAVVRFQLEGGEDRLHTCGDCFGFACFPDEIPNYTAGDAWDLVLTKR